MEWICETVQKDLNEPLSTLNPSLNTVSHWAQVKCSGW